MPQSEAQKALPHASSNNRQVFNIPQHDRLPQQIPSFVVSSNRPGQNGAQNEVAASRQVNQPQQNNSLSIHAAPFVPAHVSKVFDKPAQIVERCLDVVPVRAGHEKLLNEASLRVPALPTSTQDLSVWTGRAMWAAMLEMEEHQRQRLYETFDMTATISKILETNYDYMMADRRGITRSPLAGMDFVMIEVKVPGILEKRPPIFFDDIVRLRPRVNANVEFEGRVITYSSVGDVLLRVPRAFLQFYVLSPQFQVRFVLDTSLSSMMIHAVYNSEAPRYDELPTEFEEICSPEDQLPPKFEPLDLNLNEHQSEAVGRIVHRKSIGLLPYIVFGPAGTGKTKVVSEAVLQLLSSDSPLDDPRILVCAPSEAACDEVVRRLTILPRSALVRINPYKRRVEEVGVHSPVRGYCCISSSAPDLFMIPSRSDILKYKVIVATCQTVGLLLHNKKLSKGDFSHIIVDESSQALEPEIMIPFSLAIKGKTQLVLAGDHFQLGAAIVDPTARSRGLNRSLQERLIHDPNLPYARNDRRFISTLVLNYRSHPTLLVVPNELFYQGKLRAVTTANSSFSSWPWLPNPDFPLAFYSHTFKNKQQMDLPVFTNEQEAEAIASAILEMVRASSIQPFVNPMDVGVVCLFRGQVYLMRNVLRRYGLSGVQVGTVDDVQGQEFRAVFVSTVLSDVSLLNVKESHPILGFLADFVGDAKRFNVAITRAKEFCVVCGNAKFLERLPTTWRRVMKICLEQSSVKGEAYALHDLEPLASPEENLDHNLKWKEEELATFVEEAFL